MTILHTSNHLYITKSSELRDNIRQGLEENFLPAIGSENFDVGMLDNLIQQVKYTRIFKEWTRQTTYAIIDYLLLTYLHTDHFSDAIEYLKGNFRDYILIHELAALSWGDKKIEPEFVFELLDQTQLSKRHQYHILNEMTVSYPRKTLEYTQKRVKEGHYPPETKEKLISKIFKDRNRELPMSKGVEPVLSTEEVNKWVNKYF